MDLVQGNLYGIRTKNLTGGAMELKPDNLMRYPANIGITGHVIATSQTLIGTDGYRTRKFAPEVDNYNNNFAIRNMIIGPMVDKNGKVRGVIQLLNKLQGTGFQQDETELKALLPALGEILRTADEGFELQKM